MPNYYSIIKNQEIRCFGAQSKPFFVSLNKRWPSLLTIAFDQNVLSGNTKLLLTDNCFSYDASRKNTRGFFYFSPTSILEEMLSSTSKTARLIDGACDDVFTESKDLWPEVVSIKTADSSTGKILGVFSIELTNKKGSYCFCSSTGCFMLLHSATLEKNYYKKRADLNFSFWAFVLRVIKHSFKKARFIELEELTNDGKIKKNIESYSSCHSNIPTKNI